MHNGPALFERDFVHQRFQEVNASTVLGQPSFWSGGVRYSVGVEALSFVPNGNRDISVRVAPALYANALTRVLAVAMDHGVRKGFTQGYLDIDLASIRRSKVQNEPHQLINKWRDDADLTRKRLPQFNKRSRMRTSGRENETLCMSHISDRQLTPLRIIPSDVAVALSGVKFGSQDTAGLAQGPHAGRL